jgi:hypothetical protein
MPGGGTSWQDVYDVSLVCGEMVDSAMIGRSPRLRLAVLVTSLCACGADLAVCAAAGDVRSGDPWLRVGNLLRDVVRHVRARRFSPARDDPSQSGYGSAERSGERALSQAEAAARPARGVARDGKTLSRR